LARAFFGESRGVPLGDNSTISGVIHRVNVRAKTSLMILLDIDPHIEYARASELYLGGSLVFLLHYHFTETLKGNLRVP
jgi:hypothetical protein